MLTATYNLRNNKQYINNNRGRHSFWCWSRIYISTTKRKLEKNQILTLKPPTKKQPICRLPESSAAYDFLTLLTYFESRGQTSWTQIGLLQKEQSDLGLHCLSMRLRNIYADEKNGQHFVVIDALWVNSDNA